MRVLIYHHNDQDGYLSATIAQMYCEDRGYEVEFMVGYYKETVDQRYLNKFDRIYVLDYHLDYKIMKKFADKIRWIDHHKTAINKLSKLKDIDGVREIGKSGCLLTWEYLFPGHPVPQVIRMVNDRDIWAWEFGDKTAAFHEASQRFLRKYNVWVSLLKDDKLVANEIRSGKILLEHMRGVSDRYNGSYGWVGNYEGHEAVFLNGTATISGELHKRLRESNPEAEFAILFMLDHEGVRVGLYRSDNSSVDMSALAKKYGGGGHEGAAGFYTDYDVWIKILKESKDD